MRKKTHVSIVTPVYRAEGTVKKLFDLLVQNVVPITEDFEILLINDGSPDQSWKEIEETAKNDDRIKGINLSRNFGQHQAITCGLSISSGDYVVVIDCDLQDNPGYIEDLYAEILKGFDLVFTEKTKRKHSWHKNLFTALFNTLFNYLIDQPEERANSKVGTFSILSRKVVNAFLEVEDYQRHYLMTLRWLGFKSSAIKIEHNDRYTGKSSYNFRKLLTHALNGITYQSDKVLRLNIGIGLIISAMSIIAGLVVITLYFTKGFLSGWTSLIVTLFFMLGIILLSLGVIGLYIGKIFDQVKHRPKFLISNTINYESED